MQKQPQALLTMHKGSSVSPVPLCNGRSTAVVSCDTPGGWRAWVHPRPSAYHAPPGSQVLPRKSFPPALPPGRVGTTPVPGWGERPLGCGSICQPWLCRQPRMNAQGMLCDTQAGSHTENLQIRKTGRELPRQSQGHAAWFMEDSSQSSWGPCQQDSCPWVCWLGSALAM